MLLYVLYQLSTRFLEHRESYPIVVFSCALKTLRELVKLLATPFLVVWFSCS